MIDLYKNIKNQRILHGMSQEELAHKVGYADKTMISRIENGKIDLPQSKIEEFAKIFDVTPGYLMGWEETKENKFIKLSIVQDRIGAYPEYMLNNRNIEETRANISQIKTKENAEALRLYELYEKADPTVKAAIDTLLKKKD